MAGDLGYLSYQAIELGALVGMQTREQNSIAKEAHTLSQGTLKDNRNTASSSSRIRDDPEAVQARKKVYVICATENK
ncbi:hypothetical protein NC652_017661 [Populus alba x Populus x berolinensis]|nr:hypothetical protein NC652_017661 [Populus alba x Populus x berolinensis]